MYGVILGDSIGAPYEFHGIKTTKFKLFSNLTHFTDDTVMTIAVCEGLLNAGLHSDRKIIEENLTVSCQKWGRKYPDAGYGGRFRKWLKEEDPKPYNSWGNGSAMRVASIGWLYEDLGRTREVARWSAEITHNHPEGIKGAESTAAAIWMARNGRTKKEIKDYIEEKYGYDLSRTCDEIRETYQYEVSCQKSVPESIIAFLEGKDFEDTVRLAISFAGDADTQACIAGSIAEAYYGIPEWIMKKGRDLITPDMKEVIKKFEKFRIKKS